MDKAYRHGLEKLLMRVLATGHHNGIEYSPLGFILLKEQGKPYLMSKKPKKPEGTDE